MYNLRRLNRAHKADRKTVVEPEIRDFVTRHACVCVGCTASVKQQSRS